MRTRRTFKQVSPLNHCPHGTCLKNPFRSKPPPAPLPNKPWSNLPVWRSEPHGSTLPGGAILPCSQPLRYLGQPWLSSLAFYFMSPPPGILPPPFLLRKLYPPLNEKPTSCTLFPVVWNCHQNFSRSCSSSVWWMADCDPGHIQSLWAYNLARRFFRARNVELAFNKIKAIF